MVGVLGVQRCQHRIAQRRVEFLQHRAVRSRNALHLRRKLVQHLLAQVVEDADANHPRRRGTDPGPSRSAVRSANWMPVIQPSVASTSRRASSSERLQRLVLRQQRLDLVGAESQVREVQAADLVVRHQQRQVGQLRQRPGGQDQVAVLIHQPDEAVDEGLDRRGVVHQVEVVQHQHEVLGDLVVDLVHQRDQQGLQARLEARQAAQSAAGLRAEVGKALGHSAAIR